MSGYLLLYLLKLFSMRLAIISGPPCLSFFAGMSPASWSIMTTLLIVDLVMSEASPGSLRDLIPPFCYNVWVFYQLPVPSL
jgi:hypothetical protein